MGNKVNHPDHYQNIAGVEAIDILNDVVKDLPGKQAAMLWNSMKYLLRFQKKNGVEDLKKARTYLDYLIDDMGATQETAKDILWETLYSNEYGNMTIYAKSKEPNGMPSKLVFDTNDAAEEFENIFYMMLNEWHDEFSITDIALEMKFITSKGNKWNKWDNLITWKKVHDSFTIKPVGDKYELIFNYKDANSETLENDWKFDDRKDKEQLRAEGRFPMNHLNHFDCPVCGRERYVSRGDMHRFAVMDDGTEIMEY